MAEIIPAILEKDFSEIKNKLTFLRGRVKCVHIDIQDGVFTQMPTWPYASGGFEDAEFLKILREEAGLPFWEEFDFELDLMVRDAVENFDLYMKLGPKRLIFHLYAQENLEEFENFLEGLDMYTRECVELGLAFRPREDLGVVARLSSKVDFLHCMGSDKVGYQGEAFTDKALENIKFLTDKLPGVAMSVDIGINLDNAQEILDAGATRLTIGSSIWRSGDPITALESFQSLV
jgi:ribulose-phosphate 3-epimerase